MITDDPMLAMAIVCGMVGLMIVGLLALITMPLWVGRRILPAKGFWSRLRGRWILMSHPNYRQFKKDLVGVWSGR